MSPKKARTPTAEKASNPPGSSARPDIFRYHDYQAFLRDWFAHCKASQSGFSLRSLAKQAGLAAGYLPMLLSGKRPLTGKGLAKLAPFLGLGGSERSFLEQLVVLGTSDSHEARVDALERMKRFQAYQKNNPRETEAYEYLTHWYYVAIREMAALPGFNLDPLWIQSQLSAPVSLKEIKDAVAFLLENGFLTLNADNTVRPPQKSLDCSRGVYRIALSKYHREIFELATRSIENAPNTERNIQGHSFALSAENYSKAQEIVEEAIRKVQLLGESEKNGDTVYHLEVALFPMTKRRNRG